MKKQILLLFMTVFLSNAFSQVVSIRPDSATQGQSLRTYITMAAGAFQGASPPYSYSDIYLEQGATIIYADPSYQPFLNVYTGCGGIPPYWCDSLYADFNIPGGSPSGLYDVHVISYDMFGTPFDNVLTNGFHVGMVDATIEGDIYFDLNQNGINDAGDSPLMNHRAELNPGGIVAFTNSSGHYKFYLDSGTYSVDYLPTVSFNQTSLPVTYNATVPPDQTGWDFGVYSSQALYDQYFYVWHHPMRCFPSYGYTYIDITNNGLLPVQGSITMVHSNNMPFNNSVPAPDIISGDTLTWYYPLLAPGQSFHVGGTLNNWISFVNPPAGQTIWFNTVDSVFDALGNPLTQYVDSFSFLVTCSCDPNDKHVFPPGESPAHITPPGSTLGYTVNFQNTGNDTAFTVVIKDTLDANLDWNSFELVSYTHPVQVQMDANGVLTFTFENILLPDSNVDEPGSHGAIAYRIAVDSLLPDPTVVTNTAYIYFDANAAVVTNEAFNTLTVLQYPEADINSAFTTLCPGACIDFVNGSANATSYQWTFNGSATGSSTDPDPTNICYNTPGTYDVVLIASNVLGSDTMNADNFITVFPYSPNQSIIQSGDTLISNTGFVTYQWFYQGDTIPGATTSSYLAMQNGDYSVVCLDSNGCSVEAVIQNVMTAVDAISSKDLLQVYPNPAGEHVIISGKVEFGQDATVVLYNSIGQVVPVNLPVVRNTTSALRLNVSELQKGMYTLEIRNGERIYRIRIMKN